MNPLQLRDAYWQHLLADVTMPEQRSPISLFISHAHDDSAFARSLRRSLEEQGINVWLAESELRPGDSVVERIEEAMGQADAVLVVVSRKAAQSKWMAFERGALLERWRTSHPQSEVIPLLIDDAELPTDLAGISYLDFRRGFDQALDRFVRYLKQRFPDAVPFEPDASTLPPLNEDQLVARPELTENAIAALTRESRLLLITGPVGSGKTTGAIVIAHECMKRHLFSRAVFLDAWSLRSDDDIVRELKATLAPALRNTIEDVLQQERVLMVVDGVDRLPAAEGSRAISFIYRLLMRSTESRAIVTARQGTPRFILSDPAAIPISQVVIPPFSAEEIRSVLARRIAGVLGGEVDTAWERVLANPEISSNPALLHLLLTNLSEAPADRVDLESIMHKVFGQLTPVETAVCSALTHFNVPVSARTVGTLIDENEADHLRRMLTNLVSRGLLVEVDGRFEFAHVLFREYAEKAGLQEPVQTQGGTLYVTIDPTLIAKEDVVELLETLNALYVELGGDELIIREDEVGRFVPVEVLV